MTKKDDPMPPDLALLDEMPGWCRKVSVLVPDGGVVKRLPGQIRGRTTAVARFARHYDVLLDDNTVMQRVAERDIEDRAA